MSIGTIEGISIKGISCAVPTDRIDSVSRYVDFGKEAVDKIIDKTGVESLFISKTEQTSSDLAFVAARELLVSRKVDPNSIGALVFVTQTPDYRLPATAFVLQHRLGLPEECICFDINLGCSGYINGLFTLSSIMKISDVNRGLLLVAETPSKRISPLDRSLSMIFGDCGTATLIEKEETPFSMHFKFKSLGEKFKKIIIPSGRNRNFDGSKERVLWGDGNIRSDYDTYMNGQDVFAFSITEVPAFIKSHMKVLGTTQADYDKIILHQANQYILKQIMRKLKADTLKTPIPMVKYGNTSSTSIPLSLSFLKEEMSAQGSHRLMMVGFGVGLSIASVDLYINMDDVLPVIHSDEAYLHGSVSHE
jgi:3-oxoacyl-[acyl-carrier-protein] synthase-3